MIVWLRRMNGRGAPVWALAEGGVLMNTLPTSDIGTLLRRHRRAARLTQEELAERAGVSVDAISALERDVSRAPHKDTIELLAEALQLSGPERGAFEAAARHAATPAPPDTLSRPSVQTFLIADVRGYSRFTEVQG